MGETAVGGGSNNAPAKPDAVGCGAGEEETANWNDTYKHSVLNNFSVTSILSTSFFAGKQEHADLAPHNPSNEITWLRATRCYKIT